MTEIAAIKDAETKLTAIHSIIHGEVDAFGYRHRVSIDECVCGAPSWQQPCPWCGYYPMGDSKAYRSGCEGTMTREKFVARNVAVTFARGGRNLLAYETVPGFKEKVEAAIVAAGAVEIDNDALWDACKAQTLERMNTRLETLRGYWKMYRDNFREAKTQTDRQMARYGMEQTEREGKELKALIETR